MVRVGIWSERKFCSGRKICDDRPVNSWVPDEGELRVGSGGGRFKVGKTGSSAGGRGSGRNLEVTGGEGLLVFSLLCRNGVVRVGVGWAGAEFSRRWCWW